MTLQHPNATPRSSALLGQYLKAETDRFVILDVGARDGAEGLWAPIGPITDILGFEPDRTECDRLNAKNAGSRNRFFPCTLGDRDGPQPFYVTRFPFSTLDVIERIEIPTVTLDRFVEEHAVHHIDFVKIDTEGSEYDVLSGGTATLAGRRVLGIKTEFWWDPVIKGQKGFAEIDLFLRAQGFRFFDLQIQRYPRATLPMGRLKGTVRDGAVTLVDDGASYGQAWTGDALYFRDPVGEHLEGTRSQDRDTPTLLRLCGLLDIFDYGDSALEILETFYDRLAKDCDVDALMDAMVPPLDGYLLSYDADLKISADVRIARNARVHPPCRWRPGPSAYGRSRGS
jgi:FkbM family methyltransferase